MPVRHVILFSDTSDSEEQEEQGTGKTCEALAKEYRAKGITTTVVGIGEAEAPHTPFLRRLAAASGGRFYITSEGTDLRRIFLSETRVLAQSNLREKSVRVAATGAHPVLEGVDTAKLPALAAFVETGRRAGADTALVLEDGRPMLATWRYGLGKVGAITTDLYEGWGAWANVPEGAQTLKQTVRHLLRQKSVHRADARLKLQDRVVDLELEMPEGATEEATAVELFAIEKSGASHKIAARLEKRGPGRWTVRGMSNGEPVVIARARDSRGALVAEAVAQQDRVPELSGDGADMSYAQQLARAGDGRLAPTPEQSLARTSKPGKELTPSWPYALLAGAILVVLDLILRRFGTRARRVPAFAM